MKDGIAANGKPLYSIQREVAEADIFQGLVNICRRLIGAPVRRTAAEARAECLRTHGVEEEANGGAL